MAGRKLAVNVTVVDEEGRGHTYPAGEVVSAEVAKQITNPKAWASDEAKDEGSEPKAYEDRKVSELKAEIESRNVDREDDAKLSLEGNKSDLVAALEADDQASAGQ